MLFVGVCIRMSYAGLACLLICQRLPLWWIIIEEQRA